MTAQPGSGAETLRLDKWLWASRFFKTRQLAVEAINGGKVHLDGQRVKPGKLVQLGSRLRIQKGPLSWELVVTGISRQRRSASEAAALYLEDEASRLRRQDLVRERREQGMVGVSQVRPTKRNRRELERFRRSGEA